MKKLFVLMMILTTGVASAESISPLVNIKTNLDQMLKPLEGRKTFREMKTIANERNTDVDVAFENYIIAKKNVSVARSQFNPITTGHLLGISMGLSYFWAPMAIEAVLSIPTKIYNVQKNKYLEKAALYNLYDARDAISNELAHLYFDILTHEVILKTIDQEIQLLTYQEKKWTERNLSSEKLAELRKWILSLGIERVDIYNMYVSELAAIRTLISTTDGKQYELAQVDSRLNKAIINELDAVALQRFALLNSDKHKAAINLHRASQSNIKAVRWSILSWSGLNFSYKRKVKESRNEEDVAQTRKESVAEEVKVNVLLQLNKLNSSLDVLANYETISDDSLEIFTDSLEAMQMGQLSEDAVIETAIGAIRDFRSRVVAHYSAWSSFDDFSTSSNFDFSSEPKEAVSTSLQEKIERNPLYNVNENDFNINKMSGSNSFTLSLNTTKLDSVVEVDYIFAHRGLPNRSNDNDKSNFAVTLKGDDLPSVVSGVAIVTLSNGHQFNIKFKK